MLVISRKENETIEFPAIGVVVRVFGFSRRRVQVGIEAPISLKVSRGEHRLPHSENSVASIAEYVIGEDFEQLDSDLAALAELAETRDCTTTQKIAQDAINRIERLKRTVSEAIKSNDARDSTESEIIGEDNGGDMGASGDSCEVHSTSIRNNDSQCVREPAIGYVTARNCPSRPDLSVYSATN